jgi:hypothetical protein
MGTNHNASYVGHELCALFEQKPTPKGFDVVDTTKGPLIHEVQFPFLGLGSQTHHLSIFKKINFLVISSFANNLGSNKA